MEAFSLQLSALSSQLSAFSSQLSAYGIFLGICLFFLATAIIYNLLVIAAAAHFRQSAIVNRQSSIAFSPPVSIFRPLHGAGHDLYACLASVCRQDYPEYEVLCCVENEEDPAAPVVRQIQQDFPSVAVRLLAVDRFHGPNQKVNSLDKMFREMRFEYLAISDDDILVGPDYLRRVMAEFRDPQAGVVTCPYRGRSGGTAASTTEALGIAGEFFCGVLMARMLEGIKFAMGSTTATRKELVAAIGGFPVMADYLADDFELGNRVAKLGYRGVLSGYVVDTILTADTWSSMLGHQFRWLRSQASSRPKGHLGLIFTYGSVFLLAALALAPASHVVWTLGGAWLALRLLAGSFVGVAVLDDPTVRRWWFLLPFRELLTVGLWAASLLFKKITWRDQQFVTEGGKIVRI